MRSVFDDEVMRIQGSFEEAVPVDLEEQWLALFQDEEVRDFLPRIYRGLPRWYYREDASRTKIKSQFCDLAALKKVTLVRPLIQLYAQDGWKRKVQIGLISDVLSDGLGDWAALLAAAGILEERLENIELELFFIHQKSIPQSTEYPIHASSKLESSWLPLLEKKDLVICMPTKVDLPLSNVLRIGEYGFLESGTFHPRSGAWSMGLSPLELGVMMSKGESGPLESEELNRWLRPPNRLFAAYLMTMMGGKVYLTALLHATRGEPEDLDLVCPDASWWLGWLEEKSVPEFEGVSEIALYWKDRCHRVVFREGRRKVRILVPQQLSREDVGRLFSLSGDFIGVRGNQSWSQAVATGKPFFYDGREHNRYFFKDLTALAKGRLKQKKVRRFLDLMNEALLHNSSPQKGEWVDEEHFQERRDWKKIGEEMGNLLFDPEVEEGFQELAKIIREEHSFNQILPLLVKRAVGHQMDRSLKESEESFLNLYVNGVVPFSTIIQNKRLRICK